MWCWSSAKLPTRGFRLVRFDGNQRLTALSAPHSQSRLEPFSKFQKLRGSCNCTTPRNFATELSCRELSPTIFPVLLDIPNRSGSRLLPRCAQVRDGGPNGEWRNTSCRGCRSRNNLSPKLRDAIVSCAMSCALLLVPFLADIWLLFCPTFASLSMSDRH